ncbi:carbohydrate ABC transporter permease [Bradyrhizobium sp. 2TAF24]|uniref:carbohydrate ABC transporter permease n=1 Tax=Bradyrhizobium sp. 2TAF24 TaxID=3233011 RepID=UPI003F93C6AD
MTSRHLVARTLTYATAGLLTIFIGFPLFWMIISSLKPGSELFVRPPRLLPNELTLVSYQHILASSDTIALFRNSLIVAVATTAICLAMSTLAAYSVTRFQFPGKRLFLFGGLLSYLFPAVVLFIPVYMIVSALGLTDTLLGLILCHCILTFPFALWMLNSFFSNIPREIDEAAWVDGASFMYTFVVIILPLALPGIFSVAVFVFVLSWNEFLFASVMISSSELKTIPLGIAEFITSFDIRWGEIMAIGTLATVPVVVLFLSVQRYFLRGVMAGAVKG